MTTILAIKRENKVVIAGDGQVSVGSTVMKSTATKVRRLGTSENGEILAGFAGSTADALTLLERLEEKLEKYPQRLKRACVELAKDWRTDRYLRKLEAMMIVVDLSHILILTGVGDVLSPEDGIAAIGSGGNFALAAARALISQTNLDIQTIAKQAMNIAADICVYTNNNIFIEVLDDKSLKKLPI